VPSVENTRSIAVFEPTLSAMVFEEPAAGITLNGPLLTLRRKFIPAAVKLICIVVADCLLVNDALYENSLVLNADESGTSAGPGLLSDKLFT
jgi:hypothetical protein